MKGQGAMEALAIPEEGGAVELASNEVTEGTAARLLQVRSSKNGERRVYLRPEALEALARPEGPLSIEGKAWKHANATNARLMRDEPLFVATGLTPLLTPQDGKVRLEELFAHQAEVKRDAEARAEAALVLWTNTLEALGGTMPAPPRWGPDDTSARTVARHTAARRRVPWVGFNCRTARCERCGAEEMDEHEAAFLLTHVRCTVPSLVATTEDEADIALAHTRKRGTFALVYGGNWNRIVGDAMESLGVFAAWDRVYGQPLIPVSRSWDRDEPVIDLEALAGLLRVEGARVLVAWPLVCSVKRETEHG